MAIILTNGKFSEKDFQKTREDYENYIKVTIDIQRKRIALGGEYHADAEKLLLSERSKQRYIWGGGINLETKKIETNAIINLRPKQNPSAEILNTETRAKFLKIARRYLKVILRYYD